MLLVANDSLRTSQETKLTFCLFEKIKHRQVLAYRAFWRSGIALQVGMRELSKTLTD